jgi:hypothetical protein
MNANPMNPPLPMNIFDDLDTAAGRQASTAWARTAGWAVEERPVAGTHKIVVTGSASVVVCRGQHARMLVATENPDDLVRIHTDVVGSKLVIEQEPTVIYGNSAVSGARGPVTQFFHNVVIHGGVAAGNIINTNGRRRSAAATAELGTAANIVQGAGRTMVAIVAPDIKAISIKGSAEVFLFDVDQSDLSLDVKGSALVEAKGRVQQLEVDVSGSGNVNARELVAQHSDVSVSGSAVVRVRADEAVRARVSGSGRVRIWGNPPKRDHKVSGVGDVQFM